MRQISTSTRVATRDGGYVAIPYLQVVDYLRADRRECVGRSVSNIRVGVALGSVANRRFGLRVVPPAGDQRVDGSEPHLMVQIGGRSGYQPGTDGPMVAPAG